LRSQCDPPEHPIRYLARAFCPVKLTVEVL
jgi:hypothetical protein